MQVLKLNLVLFHLSQDKEPRGIIPLENLEVKDCPDVKKQVSLSDHDNSYNITNYMYMYV